MSERSARHRSPRRPAIASLLVLLLLASGPAHALQAKVRVFEGLILASPETNAAVLERVPEGTTVSVDEAGTNGWRRVRLSDGKRIGWILEASLVFTDAPTGPAAPTPTPTEPTAPVAPAPPAAAPGPRHARVKTWQARVYEDAAGTTLLDTLSQDSTVELTGRAEGESLEVRLASGAVGWIRADALGEPEAGPAGTWSPRPPPIELVAPEPRESSRPVTVIVRQPKKLGSFEALARATAPDPALSARARALDDKGETAGMVFWISAAGTLVFGLIAIATIPVEKEPDYTATYLFTGAGMVCAGGMLASIFMRPGNGDAIEVVNDWNAKYPEEPLEWIIPVVHYVPDTSKPAPTYRPSYNSKPWR